jgi:hypothetical protein
LRKAKGEVVQLLGGGAGNSQGVADLVVVNDFAAIVGRRGVKQTFSGFAQHHEVDVRGAWVGKTSGRVRIGFDGTHPGIEPELFPPPQVRRYFRAVVVANGWKTDGAQENCISGARSLFGAGRDVAAVLAEVGGAGFQKVVAQDKAADPPLYRVDDRKGCVGDVNADPVALVDGNVKRLARHGIGNCGLC